MKRLLIFGWLSLGLLPQLSGAADAIYINNGTITFPPQIDAITFINNGTFNFGSNSTVTPFNPTVFPFGTSSTLNFTNTGTMIGSVGFQFDNAPASAGTRKPLANFRNRLTGVIMAADGLAVLNQTGNGSPINNTLLYPSYLLISATNLINEGTLTAGGDGILRLQGTKVNLSRSGVQIEPLAALGSYQPVNTNYFVPDIAIYDNYWGQTNQVMNSANIIQAGGAVVQSPRSAVQGFGGAGGFATLRVVNPVYGIYTNTLSSTNIVWTNATGTASITNVPLTNIVQAAFVGLPPTGDVSWGVRFYPSDDFRNPFNTVSVGVTVTSTNVVSIRPDLASIYLVDTLASASNRTYFSNYTSVYYSRPQNYLLERGEPPGGIPPFEYRNGFSGNALLSSDILYKPDFASFMVTNEYAAYSASVDNIASRPPNIPAGTVTNLPGRLEIFADSLDVSRTRFRANGLLNIQTKHLINSSNAVVDCENLDYILGSTNGNLLIQSLAQESVARLNGDLYVWSGLWTNQQNMLIENYVQDPATSNWVSAPITNVVETRIYAMIFDAARMATQVPVIVNALVTHSTNVVLNDKVTVVQSLLIDGQSFTLNGGITLSNTFFVTAHGDTVVVQLENWVATNTPNLKYFTNNGTLNIPNEGHFGDDRPTPYTAFVNNGTINAYGQTINSAYCGIGGRNVAAASIWINTQSGKVEGGSLSAVTDVQLYANDLKFNRATIQTGSRLDLTVTNALFDAGSSSANSIVVHDGFRLLRKPVSGDLLGTTIESVAPAFAEVDHYWAGTNRGASSAGFSNNTALGTLVLTPGDFEVEAPPLFFFAGTGGGNALYVDLLDLSKLADYQNELAINPDLVIYFAAARLSFTPPLTNGVAQLPEEYLNGQFGGHLRWVPAFAGPKSSVAVVSNGVSILVNKALRNSLIIDSDGDGVPNGRDFFPFDKVPSISPLIAKLAVTNQPPLTARLSWNAIAHKVYSVQAATNFLSPTWQTVLYYTNSANTNGTVTIQIPVPAGSRRQYYRVGTTAN